MKTFVVLIILGLVSRLCAAEPPAAVVSSLPSPAGTGALVPQLASSSDGAVYLSWIEPTKEGHRFRVAQLDPGAKAWREAHTIAEGTDWFVNWADTPQIAAGPDGRLAAAWFVANPADHHAAEGEHHGTSYGARVSFSTDEGRTWSAPTPISRESNVNEFVALQALPDGRWLAVWLDGRARTTAKAMQLFGRILGSDAPDQLIDDRTCDCCPTSLAAFPDGSALVVYRDRSMDEVRDMQVARFDGKAWAAPSILNHDGWKIAACPVNGPVLSAQGSSVSVTWFTAANDQPKVLASLSGDAGGRFVVPTQLNDQERPLGRVDGVLLRDGSTWVSWLESSGSVRIRRVAPGGGASVGVSVAGGAGEASRAGGIPRLAKIKDEDGTPAQLLLVRTMTGEPSSLSTHLITLPPARELAAADCGCDPEADVESHPVRGRIISPMPERGTLLVRHGEIPGVMRAMTMEFKVSPATLAAARENQEILARIEKRADGKWWMTDVRVIQRPAAAP